VRHHHIQEWVNATVHAHRQSGGAEGLSRSMVAGLLQMVRSAYLLALASGPETGVWNSPAAAVKLPKPPPAEDVWGPSARRAIGFDDMAAIARLMLSQDLAPLWLMFLGGLRISEAFGLPIKHVNIKKGRLFIGQQFGWWRDDSAARPAGWDGPGPGDPEPVSRYIKHWTKSDASRRYIYIGPWLTGFLAEFIDRYHPDAATNRDALVCLVPGCGPTAMAEGFRRRLRLACARLNIEIDLDELDDPLDEAGAPMLRPHDLRRAISGHIHDHTAAEDISPRARSAYLGHAFGGVWDESATTAKSYTPVVEASMHKIAGLVDRLAREDLGDDPWVRAVPAGDRLLNVDTAAAYLEQQSGRTVTRARVLALPSVRLL
jgi:integrase